MKRAARHIDAFIGASLFTIEMHRERGLRGTMIQLPLFHPEQSSRAPAGEAGNGRPYFLFTGRLEKIKIKGVQSIIFISVFRAFSGVDLLIAGTGNFEAELRSMAAGAENIEFLGRLDQPRLQSVYRGAVATIVPSLCYETFGLIVVESWSTATPVIVDAQSSLQELVRTHGGGLVYHDPDGLRLAVEQLGGDPALRERLGREGRAAYEAEFAEPALLEHYLAVVRRLLAIKRTGLAIGPTSAQPSPQLFMGRRVFFAAPV